MIVMGDISIHPHDRPWEKMVNGFARQTVNDYRKLTSTVHEQNTLIFAQLCHYGFQSSSAITRHVTLGPSATADILFGETCKAMEIEDIDDVVKAFVTAADFVQQGNFDGIVLDMGPTSLLRQFISPISNFRQDEFGGSLENRMRFPLLVIEAMRQMLGDNFPICIELCADEMFYGGISAETSEEIIKILERSGSVDCIIVTIGTYYNLHLIQPTMQFPAGLSLDIVQAVKKVSQLPIIAGHHVGTPELAESIITEKKADAAGFIRALICDPDMPNKLENGNSETIRTCARDNHGCVGRINQSKTLACTQNPTVGYESQLTSLVNSVKNAPKQVMVVGAGPAGMEAARSARLKGHDVVIFEKGTEPGGQVNICKQGYGKESMNIIVQNLKQELHTLQVPIHLETDVTLEWVQKQKPDAIIVATGSKPIKKPIPGHYNPPFVITVWDALQGKLPVGSKTLVIENNRSRDTTATAMLLAEQGKTVTMVTSDLFIGINLAPVGDLYIVRQQLLKKGVTFLTDIQIDSINDGIVFGRNIYSDAVITFADFDTVVLDMGYEVEDRLYTQLKGTVKNLYRIGDCVAPRGIEMAMMEGREIGENV